MIVYHYNNVQPLESVRIGIPHTISAMISYVLVTRWYMACVLYQMRPIFSINAYTTCQRVMRCAVAICSYAIHVLTFQLNHLYCYPQVMCIVARMLVLQTVAYIMPSLQYISNSWGAKNNVGGIM